MLADEINELEAKILGARMKLSALSHAALGGFGLVPLSPRAMAIL